MTKGRTATHAWAKIRTRIIREALASGLTHCPLCHVPLDYNTPHTPQSAECDHIIPWAHGGTDDPDNLRVICRNCNVRRGARHTLTTPSTPDHWPHSRRW